MPLACKTLACAQPAGIGRAQACLLSLNVERGWCRGLRHQEAPQENGQEEASQAAAEDTRPAAEQEMIPPAPSGSRLSGRSAARARPGAGPGTPRGTRGRRPRGTLRTGGTVRQLTAVASGILRDADKEGSGRPVRRARPWLATGRGVGGSQAAVLAWGSQMIAGTHSPGTAGTP